MTHNSVPLLEATDLTKRYGDSVVLEGIDLDLYPGEILGIIGPNGAGKTTLMECLAGLLPVDEGKVYYKGEPLPFNQRNRVMFYLPDSIRPWGDQPVWRVTGLFREIHQLSLTHETTILTKLELFSVLKKRINGLSKGYRRRFLLALALLTPQPVLILDEPFDGFDLRQTLQVMELLRAVAINRSLILSIHQLKDAERICDRLLLLDSGRKLGSGTLSELAKGASVEHCDLEEVFLELTR